VPSRAPPNTAKGFGDASMGCRRHGIYNHFHKHPWPYNRKAKSAYISIASYLRRFCQVYLHGFPPTTVNLFRKFYPSGLHNDTDKAMEYVARCEARDKAVAYSAGCNAHSVHMAFGVYACSTPEEQSSRAKEMVRVMIGGPVDMPREADIAKTSIDDVTARFAPVADDQNDVPCEDDELSDDEHEDGMSEDSGPDSEGTDFGDFEFEPIDLDEWDENPPPVKKVRLIGFHKARGQGSASSSSSSGPAQAAAKDHELTTGERIYLLNQVLLLNNGTFSRPSAAAMKEILTKGMESGALSFRVSGDSVFDFLCSVEHACAS
jgi:hypothetical protein